MSDTTATPSAFATGSADTAPSPLFHLTGEHHPENGTLLGFWLYLMSDCLVFACLFATYGVLGRSYAGGPTGADLFDLPLVALNTSLLLLSSITYGFAMLEMERKRQGATLVWLAITGLFGAAFIGVELYEFAHLIHEGAGPQRSAFLSSFFTLVGTHGLHVTFGIVWLVTLMVQVSQRGLDRREPPPPAVPVDVLALPGRGLDRRLHLRVPDGSAAMSAPTAPSGHGAGGEHHGHHDDGASHGKPEGLRHGLRTVRGPHGDPVLAGHGQRVRASPASRHWSSSAFAAVQIVVHMVYFLHMNAKSEGGWTMLALIFTLVLVVITLSGSLWVMYHLNSNMMPAPVHDMQTDALTSLRRDAMPGGRVARSPAGPDAPVRGPRWAALLTLIALLLGLLFAAFVALGTWQVERRAWKLDLIARVDQRVACAPGRRAGPRPLATGERGQPTNTGTCARPAPFSMSTRPWCRPRPNSAAASGC